MEVSKEIEVRYAETDKMGIVYHANYLIWFEVGRTAFLGELGFPYSNMEEKGLMAPVIGVNIKYGEPFTYGDTAVIYTRVSKVTPVKTQYSYRIFKKGEDPKTAKPHVWGESLHCVVTEDSFKPVSQKRAIPELYEAYKRVETPEV